MYKNEDYRIPSILKKHLFYDPDAMTKFGTLSSEQKEKLCSYVKGSPTNYEAAERAEEVVTSLNDGEKMWFYD